MSKKYIISTIIIFLAVIVVFVVQKQNNEHIGIVEKPEPIKIGFVGPFTGPASRFGQFMSNGLELALQELGSQEREHIQIIKEDDQASSKGGVNAVKKLIEVDQVNYVIGPLNNASTVATEQLFEDNQIISLTTGLPNEQIANMGDFHFSFLPEIGLLKKHLTRYIINEKNINKLAVIYLNDEFGEELRSKFHKFYTEAGGQIVAEESFVKGSADVKTQLEKIKQTNPEAIFIAAYSNDLIAILKELEELGLGDLPKFGSHAVESPDIIQNVPDLAAGIIYPQPRSGGELFQSTRDYIKRHEIEFGYYPDPYSAAVYDSFNILYAAIKECGYENKDCVRRQLSSVKSYKGANGMLTVDKRGVASFDQVRLRTVRDGEFVDF